MKNIDKISKKLFIKYKKFIYNFALFKNFIQTLKICLSI